MWRICREARRPWPVIVPDDDVLDYMVMEAVALKVNREDKESKKQQEVNDWKRKEQERLKQFT